MKRKIEKIIIFVLNSVYLNVNLTIFSWVIFSISLFLEVNYKICIDKYHDKTIEYLLVISLIIIFIQTTFNLFFMNYFKLVLNNKKDNKFPLNCEEILKNDNRGMNFYASESKKNN